MPTSNSSAALTDVEKSADVEKSFDVDKGLNPKRKTLADQGGDTKDNWEWAMAVSGDEPSLREALNGEECKAWLDAIEAELAQMEKVAAWVPVIPPPDTNIILSLFVFHRKRNDMGSIICYKAQLVVKGYKQQFGVDYMDTFAPTVRAPSLHIPLSFAAQKGATIHQCDIKNAYLNSCLKDDISLYSELPPKYEYFHQLPPELKDKPRVISKWLVSVYGLKQGAHDWYAEVKKFFTELGYTVSAVDEAIFYKIKDDMYTIVAAATDNFTIIANSSDRANFLIHSELAKHFKVSDLGPINWLLGVSITWNLMSHTISLGQQAYIEQIINHFDLTNARVATTPMEVGTDLSLDSPHVSMISLTPAEKMCYREMIGCLMYATVMTWPDIAFAISTLSQFFDSAHSTHLQAVSRVFRYLSGTKTF